MQLQKPKFNTAKGLGIIFIVGIFGADDTAKDVKNVESTFQEFNFVVYVERNPLADEIYNYHTSAAVECNYPYRIRQMTTCINEHLKGINLIIKAFLL